MELGSNDGASCDESREISLERWWLGAEGEHCAIKLNDEVGLGALCANGSEESAADDDGSDSKVCVSTDESNFSERDNNRPIPGLVAASDRGASVPSSISVGTIIFWI